jgi:release factor glutamine methyltransferase
MEHHISGIRWRHWYESAQQAAIAADISLEELIWLTEAETDLNLLALKLKQWPEVITLARPWDNFVALWQRRLDAKIPMQYLLGFTYWRNFKLMVNPSVLIPRPETELIIDLAQATPMADQGIWVDLGTGSGAIACGLAEQFPHSTIYATDLSTEALEVAALNRDQLGFRDRVTLRQGSWLDPLVELQGRIAGIVANPPYIPLQSKSTLQPEVRDYEPALALFSPQDGLQDLRLIIEQAPQYLSPGGVLIMEMMTGQGMEVLEILNATQNYDRCEIINDLTGRERFVRAYCDRPMAA